MRFVRRGGLRASPSAERNAIYSAAYPEFRLRSTLG